MSALQREFISTQFDLSTDSGRSTAIAALANKGDWFASQWLLVAGRLPPPVRLSYGSGNGDGHGLGGGSNSIFGDPSASGVGSGEGGGYGEGFGSGRGVGECGERAFEPEGYGTAIGRGNGDGTDDGESSIDWFSGIVVTAYKCEDSVMPKINVYYVFRSYAQGVIWGYYSGGQGPHVIIREPRQQYSWSRNALTLLDVASLPPSETGLRLSVTMEEGEMFECCGCFKVPEHLVEAFRTHPAG